VLEVRHDEFAESAIDRFAEAESGVIGLGDSSPTATLSKDGEDVVVVADGFEVEEERGMAEHAECGRADEGTGHAMGRAVAECHAGRTAARSIRFFVVLEFLIEESLDLVGSGECAEDGAFGAREVGHCPNKYRRH
jgi:hypothetical protein